MVTVKYKQCNFNTQKCNCAMYIKVKEKKDSKFIFIDFCDRSSFDRFEPKFRYLDSVSRIQSELNCNNFISNETDVQEWQNVSTNFDFFKCARADRNCENYIVIIY